jgi:hypothetical protein
MRSSLFGTAACVTLFVDAHLALALLATRQIQHSYQWALPPFGRVKQAGEFAKLKTHWRTRMRVSESLLFKELCFSKSEFATSPLPQA